MTRLCACGHARDAHRHYTRASDTRCGLCGCPRWRPRRFTWSWRHAARIIAEEQALALTKTPVPPPPARGAAPGHPPGAGNADGPPVSPSATPAPGRARGHYRAPTGHYGTCLTTCHYYDSGTIVVLDHLRRRQIVIEPPRDDESGEAFLARTEREVWGP